jgi:hypothetical protein
MCCMKGAIKTHEISCMCCMKFGFKVHSKFESKRERMDIPPML